MEQKTFSLQDLIMGKLTDLEKIEVINKYKTGKFNCQQLADQYKISRMAVRQFLKRRNISINNNRAILARKYSLNENYFDIINTEEKAYFLGLLYADGCNQPQRNTVTIQLQESDKDILEKFKLEINCNKPLKFYNRNIKNPKWKNDFKLEINSSIFSKRLESLGCIKNKSLILKFPSIEQVAENFQKDFIRGYFDGDGCVGIYQNKSKIGKHGYKNITCNITSSLWVCEEIKKILTKNGVNTSIVKHPNGKATRVLVLGGNKNAIKFLNWLYEDSKIYLKRKYDKYIEIKKYLKERYGY